MFLVIWEVVLGTGPRALCLIVRYFTTELYPLPNVLLQLFHSLKLHCTEVKSVPSRVPDAPQVAVVVIVTCLS